LEALWPTGHTGGLCDPYPCHWVQMNGYSYFAHLLYDFSEFCTRNLHLKLLSNCKFHENWGKKGCTFLMEVYEISLIFVCFSLNLDNIQYRKYAQKVSENQCNESHTCATSLKNLHLYFPHLFLDLGEIQCKIFAHNVLEQAWVLPKLVRGKL
jgi:hypothetical protein